MTFKNAAAGLPHGGGKSGIITKHKDSPKRFGGRGVDRTISTDQEIDVNQTRCLQGSQHLQIFETDWAGFIVYLRMELIPESIEVLVCLSSG